MLEQPSMMATMPAISDQRDAQRLIASCTALHVAVGERVERRLNHLKKPFFSPWPGFSSIAASAGDSVSATTPESTTETAMVIANCL